MTLFEVYNTYPIDIVQGKGNYVWDSEGGKYLDLYGGHAVISVGHSHEHYVNRLKEQLDKIGFYSNSVNMPIQREAVDMLGKISGYSDYKFFFVNSGSEAVENALKLASFHTGRKKVMAFKNAFHGRTSLSIAITDVGGIQAPVNETPFISWAELNDMDSVKAQLMSEDYCAVIVEGIQGLGGIHIAEPQFLEELHELCKSTGTMLVVDEIQSGFGRSGKFFAHQYSNVRPDLITVAKGMGNGFPVGGVIISPEIDASFGLLGTTFGGNQLASAAVLAVLEVLAEEDLVRNAGEVGSYLLEQLSEHPGIAVRGKGLMIGIDLPFPAAQFRKELLFDEKIFVGSAKTANTIRLLPALNLSKTEADIFLSSFQKILSSVAQ